MIEVSRPWSYANEPDALHFMIRADGEQRRIKLQKSENEALYVFLVKRITQRDTDSNGGSN